MGRPNLTFSKEKGREVSYLEANVDSIKRRLLQSAVSRNRGQVRKSMANEPVKFLHTMPKKQMEIGRDESGSHHGSELKKKNKSKGHGSGFDSNSHTGGIRPNPKDSESTTILDLGAYTDAANTAVQSMLATQDTMKSLADLYTIHLEGIRQIDEIQARSHNLEEQCRDKDEKIKKQDTTIDTLWAKTRHQEELVVKERKNLVEERRVLEEDKKKAEKDKATAAKRLKAQEAEQENKLQKEFEKRQAKLEKQFKDREQELERGMQKREDESKHRLATLEADNTALLKKTENLEKKNKEHKATITKAEDAYDDLVRVKDSHKEQARRFEIKLKAMEDEFGLTTRTVEFYTKEFAEISCIIEQISIKYFTELKIESHETYESPAPRLSSRPLSDIIWQPFSSEKAVLYPDLISILDDIAAKLAESSHGRSSGPRTAAIWRALTMRGVQSLPPTPLPPTPANPPPLSRVERVVSKVISILSPLVSLSQEPQFRDDLLALANSAISVWSSAQTGGFQLVVSSSLERTRRNEWRSFVFDPPSTDSGLAEDVVFATHPRIFTLFPRVTALKISAPVEAGAALPGSWPEPREPCTIETCIHPGTGLPEWSALVLKGKDEESQRQEMIEQDRILHEQERIRYEMAALEKQNRDLEAHIGRNGLHSRNGSMAGLASGPTSPTAQWMGTRRVIEND
ncbi:hypothetical protein B0J14DRAFT_644456 [Halenospora varia]|nr:hypothetical protein B0J14DRAFT_644456 [Halenospora varia]